MPGTLISTTVPNLINGVSQQADDLRFPSQCDEQINKVSSVVDGLSKRPPLNHIKKLYNSGIIGEDSWWYSINRDLNEQYAVVIRDSQTKEDLELEIFDLDGTAITIKNDAGSALSDAQKEYLVTSDPKTDLKAVTIADHTIIVNRAVTPVMDTTVSTARDPEGLVFVKLTQYGATFTVRLYNDVTSSVASYTVVKTTTSTTTNYLENQGAIATLIYTALVGGAVDADDDYDISVDGPLIHIKRKDSTDFRLEVECTIPDGLFGFKDEVQSFSQLPKDAYDGFTIKVVGNPEDEGDDYWVKFVTNTPGITNRFVEGTWQETIEPGTTTTIDEDKMPHLLISNGPDFTFKPATWVNRIVGDTTTNTDPSFIGYHEVTNITTVADVGDSLNTKYFLLEDTAGSVGFWFDTDDSGSTIPAGATAADRAVEVTTIVTGDSAATVATKLAVAIGADSQFSAAAAASVVTVTDAASGPRTDATAGDSGFTMATAVQGTSISIRNILFYRNRLGFLSDENIIMSEAGTFFNFFRTTVLSLLDADPIDVGTSHTKVSILNSAAAVAETMTLWSDQTQFTLTGEPLLTPASVQIPQTTEYVNLGDVAPVTVGDAIFFAFNRGEFSGIREYVPVNQVTQFAGMDLTRHVPRYIKGNVTKIVGSDAESMLFVLTDNFPTGCYVYKWHNVEGGDRIQSSWSTFDFGTSATLRDVFIIESTAYMVITRTDGTFLEKMNLEDGLKDDDSNITVRLDRRVTEADCTSIAYSAITGNTTMDLPYTPLGGDLVANGDFALGSGDVFTNWVLFPDAPSTIKQDATAGVGGGRCIEFEFLTAANLSYVVQRNILEIGRTYELTVSTKHDGTKTGQILLSVEGESTNPLQTDVFVGTPSTVYQTFTVEFVAVSTNLLIKANTLDGGTMSGLHIYIDDVVVKPAGTTSEVVVLTRTTEDVSRNIAVGKVSFSGDTVTIPGDLSGTPLWLGMTYTSKQVLTRPTLRIQSATKGSTVVNTGRFQVRYGKITYDDTMVFDVKVLPLYRSPYTYTFQNSHLNVGNAIIDQGLTPADGVFRFPVFSRNDQVAVEIINNTPFPSNLLNIHWEGKYFRKSREV